MASFILIEYNLG